MFRDPMSAPATSFYKRSNFVTHLPVDCLYSPSHFWIAKMGGTRLRIGFTKFATRMLGELVEANFPLTEGDAVEPGQSIGGVEGFKAASEVLCVMRGAFVGMNPALAADACLVKSDPYEVGWLYAVRGEPEEDSLDVHGYVALLQATIQKMQDAGYGGD